jgi:hypothetical protein
VRCATATQPGQQTAVPDVVDQPQATAEQLIVAAELAVGTVTDTYSSAIVSGNVISQDPAGGSLAPIGSAVDLSVSLGPAPGVVCADIPDKSTCNNEPTCEWQGSPKSGSCVEVAACTPATEGPVGDATCSDGLDNDCDTLTDGDGSICDGNF